MCCCSERFNQSLLQLWSTVTPTSQPFTSGRLMGYRCDPGPSARVIKGWRPRRVTSGISDDHRTAVLDVTGIEHKMDTAGI